MLAKKASPSYRAFKRHHTLYYNVVHFLLVNRLRIVRVPIACLSANIDCSLFYRRNFTKCIPTTRRVLVQYQQRRIRNHALFLFQFHVTIFQNPEGFFVRLYSNCKKPWFVYLKSWELPVVISFQSKKRCWAELLKTALLVQLLRWLAILNRSMSSRNGEPKSILVDSSRYAAEYVDGQ